MPTLQIIIASTRPGRAGEPIARWFTDLAIEHGAFSVEVADLQEIALPFFDEPKHPRLGEYEHEHSKAWSRTVAGSDAFVLVMPEYNYGYTAPLKNALDYLSAEWRYKPVGFVSYGGVAGGTRAVQLLKPVLSALQLTPAVNAVTIPFMMKQLGADGFSPADEQINSANAMLGELDALQTALATLRA